MSFIFNSTGDVAVFYVISLALFGTYYITAQHAIDRAYRSEWYQVPASRIAGMAPTWAMGLLWGFIYVLMVTAYYIFFRNAAERGQFGQLFDVTSLLIYFFIMLTLAWSVFFFAYRMPWLALIDLILCVGIDIAAIYYFFTYDYTASAVLILICAVWLIYPVYLNCAFIWWYRAEVAGGWTPGDDEASQKAYIFDGVRVGSPQPTSTGQRKGGAGLLLTKVKGT